MIFKIKDLIDFVFDSLDNSKDPESIMKTCVEKGMKETNPLSATEIFLYRKPVTNQNKLLTYVFKSDIVELCSINFLFFKNELFNVGLLIPAKKIFFFSNIEKLFQLMHELLCEKRFKHHKPLPPWKDDGGTDFFSELERISEPYDEEQRKLESIQKSYHLTSPKTFTTFQAELHKHKKPDNIVLFQMSNSTIQHKSSDCYSEDWLNQSTKITINYRNQLDSLPKKIAIAYEYGFAKQTPKIFRIEYRCESCKKNVDYILSQRDDDKENLVFNDLNISSYIGKNIICKKCKNNHIITKNDIVKSMDIKKRIWPTKFDLIKNSIKSRKDRQGDN